MATDNFDRADAGTLGANWTDQAAGLSIASNRAVSTGGAVNYAYYNAVSFADDQYAQAVLGYTVTQYTGLTVRASGTGGSMNCYLLFCGAVDVIIYKNIAGAVTLLQTIAGEATVGSTYKLTVQGTTLKVYKDGAQIGTDQATGGELSSGSAGLAGFSGAEMDDWEGGDLGGGGGGAATNAKIIFEHA